MEYIAYFLICLFWGLSSIAVKIGITNIDPFTFNFFRFFIASFVLIIYNLIKRSLIKISKKDFQILFVSSSLMYFFNSFFVTNASKRLDASIITIFFCLVPLIMVIAQSVIEKKLIVGWAGVLGIISGLVGITIVSLSSTKGIKVDIIGLIFITLGVSSWALGSIYFRSKKLEINLMTMMMYQSLITLFLYFIIVFLFTGFKVNGISKTSIIGISYMGIVDSVLATTLYAFLIKKWKLSLVSTYAYINPIIGLVASYFILNELISVQKVLGMIIILVSVFFIQYDDKIIRFFNIKVSDK